MRAAVVTAYGGPSVVQVRAVARPRVGEGQLLVRVVASTVTRGDTELREMAMPWLFRVPLRLWLGVRRPRRDTVLGMELAGIVEEVGPGVEGFAAGGPVFGLRGMGFGGNAEYATVAAKDLIAKAPADTDVEQLAALAVGGLAALGYLRKGGIQAGARVLVRGASGSIGTYAVQLAKHQGAHVTAICPAEHAPAVTELGADEVIASTSEDFVDRPERYDLMLDVVGRMPIARCLRVLTPHGRYVRGTIPGVGEVLRALWTALTSRKRVVMGDAGGSAEDLAHLAQLVHAGSLRTVIDRRYPLAEISQAHDYVAQGHKRGNVIITLPGD